jgi:hypothetical protein
MKRILRLSVTLMTSCALPLFAQSDKEIKEIEAQVKSWM